jgi:hypothetical protein
MEVEVLVVPRPVDRTKADGSAPLLGGEFDALIRLPRQACSTPFQRCLVRPFGASTGGASLGGGVGPA